MRASKEFRPVVMKQKVIKSQFQEARVPIKFKAEILSNEK